MLIRKPQDPRAAKPSNPPTGLRELARARPGFGPGNLRPQSWRALCRASGLGVQRAPGEDGMAGHAGFPNNRQAVRTLKVLTLTQGELSGPLVSSLRTTLPAVPQAARGILTFENPRW